MSISFIIIGRNEEKNLKRCIESIYNTISYNKIDNFEIVYVDSNSTDNSISVVKGFKEIRVYRVTGSVNAAIGRNIGARESSGNILFFIDGDMEIYKEFLSYVLDQNINLKYDFVSGQIIDVVDGYHDKLRYQFEPFGAAYTQLVPGGIFLIKRVCWESVGGMRTKYNTGEEADLGLRLLKIGFKFTRLKEPITKHFTYPSQDLARMWRCISNKSAFYPRCLTYRDHITNKYMYIGIWELDKTFILLIIAIFLSFIIPPAIPFSVYLLVVIARSIKQVNNLSGFKYVLYFLIFDILNLIFLFTFFPTNKKLEYVRI